MRDANDKRRTYDAREIANFILDYCDCTNRKVSNLSLQKLVYFCHAWVIKGLGRPLVAETFEAWEHGPVLPYLYREFKDCNDSPIKKRAKKLNLETGERILAEYDFDPEVRKILDDVIEAYSKLSAFQLVSISHAAGSPWELVRNKNNHASGEAMRISNDMIEKSYRTDSLSPT